MKTPPDPLLPEPGEATLDRVRKKLLRSDTNYDPDLVLTLVEKASQNATGEFSMTEKDNAFKAMTIQEFHHGLLMMTGLSEAYRTFSIEFSRQLQQEYDCQSPSEKSLAELASFNYSRCLEIQTKIEEYFDLKTITSNGVGYLKFLSLEMDRAQRQYLTAVQTLKSLRQPQLQFNIKTNTAVVGGNQVVQVNNHEINKAK